MRGSPPRSARLAVALLAFCVLGASRPPVSNLKPDETIVFYPSYLTWEPRAQRWQGAIHGKVHEPREGASAALMLAALRRVLDIHTELTPEEERLFDSRASEFLADNQRRKRIVVRVGERSFASGPSRADGRFRVPVTLAEGEPGALVPFAVRLAADDARAFGGALRLIARQGLSVISDIDDTVKESNVLDRDQLLANAFLRPYRAIEGMPRLYEAWAGQGVAVHYVTAGPWQLYPALWSFFEDCGLPGVEIQMRDLRVKSTSVFRFFQDSQQYKLERIRKILRSFPERRFVLVGDSGENDPEVYAAIAADFPESVRGIFIRAVREAELDRERCRALFDGLEGARWILFERAEELPEDLDGWLADGGS